MKITTKLSQNNETIVHVHGEFDAFGCQQTKKIWHALANSNHSEQVILDLAEVTFIDSSGVGAIVFLFKKLRIENKDLVITGVGGQVKELLNLLRIDQAIATFNSLDAYNNVAQREC